MHLVESYALLSGSKIDHPHTSLEFYPIPFDKYVVFHSGSENKSRIYDFFDDVIEHLKPLLDKEGINIVQIGGDGDALLEGVFDARGSTKRQMQFILKNSLCLIGNDTCSSHFASALGCKIVVIHSCLYPQNSIPYFSKPEDLVVIEADRKGDKPSFSLDENPKTVNNIKPEFVAQKSLDLLGIKYEPFNFETIFMGSSYSELAIDIIPDGEFNLPQYKDGLLNIRLDIHPSTNLKSWADNAQLNLIIKDNACIEILKEVRDKIFAIHLNAETKLSESQVEAIHNLGVPVMLYVNSTSDERFSELALKWFDYNITRINHDPIEIEDGAEYFFSSRKYYSSSKGMFLTEQDYYDKVPMSESEKFKPVQAGKEFLNDKEHYRIIKKWKK